MSDGPADPTTQIAGSVRPIGRVLGVILAGGLSRRMGTDKGFVKLAGKPLIAHVIARFEPQVDVLILNASGGAERYAGFALPVVGDMVGDHPGPLAGILAAMRWATMNAPGVTHVATAPVDTPFFPISVVGELRAGLVAVPGGRVAFAATAQGPQPVFVLIDVGLVDDLDRAIASGRARRVVDWLRAWPHAEVPFDDRNAAFFNVNTPEDVTAAERMTVSAK